MGLQLDMHADIIAAMQLTNQIYSCILIIGTIILWSTTLILITNL